MRRRPIVLSLPALVVALLVRFDAPCRRTAAVAAAAGPGYRVITHPGNQATTVDRKFLAEAYLKKVSRWPGAEPLRPVDQLPESAVRRQFSDEVIKRPVTTVKSYWQQQVFSGRDVPPPELENDEAVVRYVLRHPGALGYVSGAAPLEGAKMLTVR
jgi:hypothetical protein